MTKVAFIGAGNMNRAIILGLINSGFDPKSVMVTNPSPEKRLQLAEQHGILNSADNLEAAKFADIIVLGVKPHLITQVCSEMAAEIDVQNKCFISVAAGTTMAQIQTALNNKGSVIRVMPNTPSQLGLGVSGMFACQHTTASQKEVATEIMQAVGIVKWLKAEAEIDDIIAVSGSGPAYFFLFMEAMEAKANALGFSPEEARALVQQTALGAAQMVVNNNISIGQLRENVTSKGGTTQAALNTFREGGLIELVDKAMDSAIARAKEMAQD